MVHLFMILIFSLSFQNIELSTAVVNIFRLQTRKSAKYQVKTRCQCAHNNMIFNSPWQKKDCVFQSIVDLQ